MSPENNRGSEMARKNIAARENNIARKNKRAREKAISTRESTGRFKKHGSKRWALEKSLRGNVGHRKTTGAGTKTNTCKIKNC